MMANSVEDAMKDSGNYYRTELFRIRFPIYKAAAECDIHPSRLSLMLNGHIPLSDSVAEKLDRVLQRHSEVASV